jgi:hypothetical protein
MHKVRGEVIKQETAFCERFAYESELALFEISQPAMRQARGA